MRSLFILCLTLFTVSSVVAQEDQLLETTQAGVVKIGMSADEVYHHFNIDSIRLFNQFLEGTFSPALDIRGEGLLIELQCDKVWRVKVNNRLYKTKNGLGVGSTLKSLLTHYPGAHFFQGEGNYVLYVDSLHMSFVLAMEGLDENKYYEAIKDFPEETSIAQVLVLSK